MTMFYATFEKTGPREAIVVLVSHLGEWSGASRVKVRHARQLYAACFGHAEVAAAHKGGRLERFAEGDLP